MIADITLNFSYSDPSDNKSNLRLTLAKVADDWHVDNVAQEGVVDLRKLLK